MEQIPINKKDSDEKDLKFIFGSFCWLSQLMQNPFDIYHTSLLQSVNISLNKFRKINKVNLIEEISERNQNKNYLEIKICNNNQNSNNIVPFKRCV